MAIGEDGEPVVVTTHDLRANMLDVRQSNAPYAAHTAGRNSYAAGVAIMAMRDARPDDFGAFPLRDDGIEALCAVAAALARAYDIAIDAAHVMTHAEAAIVDGYFGAGGEEERWDIARLEPSPRPLVEEDARAAGATLRAWCSR